MTSEWQSSLNYPEWKVNGTSYLQMLDGIVYGEDPRQGYVEGNIFYHPEMRFKFAFPTGWQFQNSPMQVSMAPQDGKALMVFTMANGSSLQEAAQTTIQGLELTVKESKSTTVNGMPALAAISQQVTQDQSTGQQHSIPVLSYFIEYNGMYFAFHGLSAETDFNTFFPILQSSMQSFMKLTEASKINVKPDLLRVRKVTRTTTLADALRSFGVPQNKMEELVLLNNMEMSSRVQAGQLIKVVSK